MVTGLTITIIIILAVKQNTSFLFTVTVHNSTELTLHFTAIFASLGYTHSVASYRGFRPIRLASVCIVFAHGIIYHLCWIFAGLVDLVGFGIPNFASP